MQTTNKPENNNNSHEAHPSLGKLALPKTKEQWRCVAESLAMRLCCDKEAEADQLLSDEYILLKQIGRF